MVRFAFSPFIALALSWSFAFAQDPTCPAGMLLEPYENICASINDVRDLFIPPVGASQSADKVTNFDQQRHESDADLADDPPIPGTGFIGVRYLAGSYGARNSAHLHTKMFVYPAGLGIPGLPGWIYTPATNRMDQSTEVVGMYRSWSDGKGLLGVFGRPCSLEYPCPDGATSNDWQFTRHLEEMPCNITNKVDEGGHTQLVVHYAHHSDRLDNADPPLWKNAIYLWNYCKKEWDLTWEHIYRQNKEDCSLAGCSWWGPTFEVFGDQLYPEIPELGFEKSLFIFDGIRSELRSEDGAGFVAPEAFPNLVPWITLHLDPNRGFGAGNSVKENNPPTIMSQSPLTIVEDSSLELTTGVLDISDPDIDPAYHVAFTLTILEGDNYVRDALSITASADYYGMLSAPITVSDGAAESHIFDLQIQVTPVNDAPTIIGQTVVATLERTPILVSLDQVMVKDPDNDASEFVLSVMDGTSYERNGNTITPLPGVNGEIFIPITVADPEISSPAFDLLVMVTPDEVPPQITLLGDATITLHVGDSYQDSGATAWDDLDGDISARITVTNNVNSALPGTYSVTYAVSDVAGNEAEPIARTVVVQAQSTSGDGGDGGGGCFIATAAYGSYLNPNVEVLREFRDRRLMTNIWGRMFVSFYYAHSPPMAKVIEKHSALKVGARVVLTPIIYTVLYPRIALMLILALLAISLFVRRGHRAVLS